MLRAATAAWPAAIAGSRPADAAAPGADESFDDTIAAEIALEQAWTFFRSFYQAKDTGDAAGFIAHFANSGQTVYQDAVLGLKISSYATIAAALANTVTSVNAKLGAGRFAKLFHVTGDLRYGAIVEYVDLVNTFYSTNGLTSQTVMDLDQGLIARDTDYWDSRQMGETDIAGPAVTTGVAFPLGAIHPGGVPRSSPAPALPGEISLDVGITGQPSASRKMVEFCTQFHDALLHGSVADIAGFFTEDATYVNPLIHQGPVLYANFDQTITVRGRDMIATLLAATLEWLPDCRASKLIHVVGSLAGGGFEWKAGGQNNDTGLDRTGLHGCTALDLYRGKIQRMSVKFDTFQLNATRYSLIRSALRSAGVIDQRLG